MIVVKGEDGDTHYLIIASVARGCGRKNAVCGKEVWPEPELPDGTAVTCWYCAKAVAMGESRLTTGRPQQKATQE